MKKEFAVAIAEMVRECFEGTGGTPYFTGEANGETLLVTLANLDADQASRRIDPNVNTVVAHTRHLLEAIAGSNRWATTGTFQADFTNAWREQEAVPARWDQLRNDLESEYRTLLTWLADDKRITDENLCWTISILPHCAYHLGAIRQLAKACQHTD